MSTTATVDVIRAADLTPADRKLLKDAFPRLRSLFWGSVWQQCEAEDLVRQTLGACKINLEQYEDPFSWLGEGTRTYSGAGLVDCPEGMRRLLTGGYLVVEDAPDGLVPPEDIIHEQGKPQVLRLTRKLLDYTRSQMK